MNITPSQQKKLDAIKTRHGKNLVKHSITKGGLLFVRVKYTYAKNLLYWEAYYGRRGGWLETIAYRTDKTIAFTETAA